MRARTVETSERTPPPRTGERQPTAYSSGRRIVRLKETVRGWLRTRLVDLNDGKETSRVITSTAPTLTTGIDRQAFGFVEVNKAEETFILRKRNLLLLLKFLGPCPVSSITADDLQRFATD